MHSLDDDFLTGIKSLTDDLDLSVAVSEQDVAAGYFTVLINYLHIGSFAVMHDGRGQYGRTLDRGVFGK